MRRGNARAAGAVRVPGLATAALSAALVAVLAAGCGGDGGTGDPGPGPADVPADLPTDLPGDDVPGTGDVRPGTCRNGVLDPDESDRDCGGPCEGCLRDQACRVHEDCLTGWCAGGLCGVSTCEDDLKGPGETDVDCGGNCPPCAGGKTCNTVSDCVSGMCVLATCVDPNCEDLQRNGNETDVDCGGAQCPDCLNGRACRDGGDCTSGRCANGTCRPCTTAADCPGEDQLCEVRTCTGGVCGRGLLEDGAEASSQVPGDCRRSVCDGLGGARVENDDADLPDDGRDCTVDGCSDGAATQSLAPEGSPCTEDKGKMCDAAGACLQCREDADCASLVCLEGGKCGPATCQDQRKNGNETDVDCGGGCPACADGLLCNVDGECQSGACDGGTCAEASCDDGRKNGLETGEDCGGGKCPGCELGGPCRKDEDCLSGRCLTPQCVQCTTATDCPGADGECRLRTCEGYACGETLPAFGTVLAAQQPGDCRKLICDGQGGTNELVDNTDAPDDGFECTEGLCEAGVPVNRNLPGGTPCGPGGAGTCDGNGACTPPPA